jgi:hypothetical protein
MEFLVLSLAFILGVLGYMYLKDKITENTKVPFDHDRLKII